MSKPTAYQLTISPEVLYIFMRVFGASTTHDREVDYKVSRPANHNATLLYNTVLNQLIEDGWMENDDTRVARFLP